MFIYRVEGGYGDSMFLWGMTPASVVYVQYPNAKATHASLTFQFDFDLSLVHVINVYNFQLLSFVFSHSHLHRVDRP